MRRSRLLVAILMALILPAAAAAGEDLMKEVTAIGDTLAKAMVENDIDTMLGLYAEDAISLPNYGPRMEGVDSFRQHHGEMAASGMKVTSFTSEPTDVWKAGNQVIEIGTFAIELTMPNMPQPIQDKGKYLTIYIRGKGGDLKIKAETWNTDMNPMEMGAGQ